MRAARNAPETQSHHNGDIEFDGAVPSREETMIAIATNNLINVAAATLAGAAIVLSAGQGTAQAASKIVAHVGAQRLCDADRLIQADPPRGDVVLEEVR